MTTGEEPIVSANGNAAHGVFGDVVVGFEPGVGGKARERGAALNCVAHHHAFRLFGGMCRRGIYDNMTTAVETVFVGKERRFNRRFLAMCSHYLVELTACTPAAAWEKGQVENRVGNARERLFTPRLHFANYVELNAWLEARYLAQVRESAHPEQSDKTVWEVFQAERESLIPYRGPFDGFREIESRCRRAAWCAAEDAYHGAA